MINKLFIVIAVLLFTSDVALANGSSENGLMDSAKFFVVVGVLTTILAGIFFLLIYLERKISKLEQQSTKQ